MRKPFLVISLVVSSLGLISCQGGINLANSKTKPLSIDTVAHADLLKLTEEVESTPVSSELDLNVLFAAVKERALELAAKYDIDLDGYLDQFELENASYDVEELKAKIDEIDADKNGKIEGDEIKALRAKILEKIKGAIQTTTTSQEPAEDLPAVEDFEAKRGEICSALQDLFSNMDGDKFFQGMALKNVLAKCANISVGEDGEDGEDAENSVDPVMPTPMPEPLPTPAPDKVCQAVSETQVQVFSEGKEIYNILVKTCAQKVTINLMINHKHNAPKVESSN